MSQEFIGYKMRRIFDVARRVDAFCGHLNAGLFAFVVVLTLIVLAAWTAQHPEIVQPDLDAAAAAAGIAPDPPATE